LTKTNNANGFRKMSDKELIREGKAARYLCSSEANFGKPPRDEFVVGLRLCKEEWPRRHPQKPMQSEPSPRSIAERRESKENPMQFPLCLS
jgi:hypothetical protein